MKTYNDHTEEGIEAYRRGVHREVLSGV